MSARTEFRALATITIVLGILATVGMRSLIAPLVVGAWFAGLTHPLITRLSNRIGNRRHIAALATVILVLAIVVPIVLLAVPLSLMIAEFVTTFLRSPPHGVVRQLIESASGGAAGAHATQTGAAHSLSRIVGLLREIAPSLAGLVSGAFATLSGAVIQVFILAVSSYYFSAQSAEIMATLRKGSPLAEEHFDRLCKEFLDVARAMLMGELLTAAAQGVMAGVIYAVLRVPHAGFFAVLTGFVSLIPTVGSALVWVPLCAILAAAGRIRDAAILGVLGVVVIGSIDNILRPFFSRLGANRLHPLLLFVGIFGGLEAFGGWGLILGPLVLALFVASFRLLGDDRDARRAAERVVTAPDVISTAELPVGVTGMLSPSDHRT